MSLHVSVQVWLSPRKNELEKKSPRIRERGAKPNESR
jgi:hypothetical protein